MLSERYKFKNLRVGLKYTLVLTVTNVLFTIAIIIAFSSLNNINQSVDHTIEKNEASILSSELVTLFHQKYAFIPQYFLNSEDEHLIQYLDLSSQFTQYAKELKANIENEEQLSIFNQLIENNQAIDELFFNDVVPNIQKINTERYLELDAQAVELKNQVNHIGVELKTILVEENKSSIEKSKDLISKSIMIIIVIYIFAVLFGISFLILLSRKITRELNKIIQTSDSIAQGNLNFKQLDYISKDEIGSLSASVNIMGKNLHSTIYQVSDISKEAESQSVILDTSYREVNEGMDLLSSAVQEIAHGIHLQAQSASEIASHVQNNNDIITQANQHGMELVQFSDTILSISNQGQEQMNMSLIQMNKINHVVQTSVDKMNTLENNLSHIANLVSLIKEISEKTNLLSLNASIEAARAGEAGRGFTVVAEEVRKLASQTALSIKDVTDVVDSIRNDSQSTLKELEIGYQEVNKGTEQIKLTGDIFQEIRSDIIEMSHKISSISDILKESQQSSHLTSESVEHIAAVSQESNASVEEVSAAIIQSNAMMNNVSESASKLSQIVENMNHIIKKFEV